MINNIKKIEKSLKDFTKFIALFENAVDAEMTKPSTAERGRRIAGLMNQLSFENQRIMHFILHYSFEKIKEIYHSKADCSLSPKQEKDGV